MTTVIDYVGRKADILAFRGAAPSAGDQLLTQALASPTDGGLLTAGIEKAAQRFLLALCTPQGSKKYAPNDGTLFIPQARQGYWRTTADVQASFYSAELDARRQIQQDEQATDPADERYGSVVLDSVVLDGDRVALTITYNSLAGSSYTFLAPISVSLR